MSEPGRFRVRIRRSHSGSWFYAEVVGPENQIVASKPCCYLLPFKRASRAARAGRRLLRDYQKAQQILAGFGR